jgi:hypothetical protein
MIDFYASIFEDNFVRKIFLSPANPVNVLGPYNVLTPYNVLNPYNVLTPYNILMPLEHGALIGSSLFPSVPTLPLNQGQSPSSLILGMGPPGAHSHSHIGNFLDTRGYVGARFEGGSTHYAWIDIELSNNLEQLTIHGWAYESDPLTPINAGATDAVPEPATLALLAIGAAGIIDWRRRQRRRKIKG